MEHTRSVEFTEQALRTLGCVGEVARVLSASPELGEIVADDQPIRQVLLFGFRITYVVDDDEILVMTARPHSAVIR
jgi:hypothetical protein